MAQAVAQAIAARGALVVEAGTGVGKTFAYLVPLLLAQRRALVSTATKSLQDQLFLRDLPRLRDALQLPIRLALLKGRSSYLCLHRLESARRDAPLPDRASVAMLARIERWAQTTQAGDLAEVSTLDDRSPLIPLVSSTRDNCLGSECPRFRDCHVVQARREAMAADLVVVNHHLFCADIALRDTGVAELLPTVDAVVFDEAHQLLDTGLQFLGQQLATGALHDLARDLLKAGLAHARGLAPWQETAAVLEQALRQLRLACAGPLRDLRGVVKLHWQERAQNDDFQDALSDVGHALADVAAALAAVAGAAPDLDRLGDRVSQAQQQVATFGEDPADGRVRWMDVGPREVRLVESPLQVRELFEAQRARGQRAWVFTSATLGTEDTLSWFSEGAALEDATKLRVNSPFDYPVQARVWVPKELPLPNSAAHPPAVGALAGRLAAALGGRTFVLTTTLRVLPVIAEAVREAAAALGVRLDVLVQGAEPRRTLLRRFLEGEGQVLVGSASFWEGIDVVGDRLQCVVIDKLPFPPPNDPLVQARSAHLKRAGRDPFNEYHVAEAAIALKQGAGRLIRSETDRGLLVLGDARMARMGYGRRLLAALPPMTPLDDEPAALAWLHELAAAR
ncbi:MAG: ATP-dependent DNA helicase [Aquabacterium sp.]